ncbi:MAG: hypothetical protein JJU13_11650 [Balneolaceae bacterium]|nr:hypothetical protein [Balneolaceae bacterium]
MISAVLIWSCSLNRLFAQGTTEDLHTPVPDGHNLRGEPIPVYVYSDKAAGGLFASAEDIARFVASGMLNEINSSDNILTQNSLRELYSPVIDMADIYALVAFTLILSAVLPTGINKKR